MKKILLAVALVLVFLSTGYAFNRGQEVLLSIRNIDLSEDGETVIFTVPRGYRLIITKAVLVVGIDAGMTQISIGQDGDFEDGIPIQSLSNLDSQYDAATLTYTWPQSPAIGTKSYAPRTVIKATVYGAEGGAENKLFLYGILY